MVTKMREELKMKTLFYFQGQETSFEVFAETEMEAAKIINDILGKKSVISMCLKLVTQNYSCPKCSCGATECNYQ